MYFDLSLLIFFFLFSFSSHLCSLSFVLIVCQVMPLVIICGCPGSGKSAVAARLHDVFEHKGLKSMIVHDNGLGDYLDAATEKKTRGELFSAVERALSKEMIVIVDALNYIKGFLLFSISLP